MNNYIVDTIEWHLEWLDAQIEDFEDQFNKNAILFMNYETQGVLESKGKITTSYYDDEGCFGHYNDRKVYCNSDLDFGVVEVR